MNFCARRAAAMVLAAATLLLTATAGADTPLRIGVIWSYSNTDATLATFDAGMDAYIRMHGNRVAGRTVEFVRRDDGTGINPEGAKRKTQELIVQAGVDVIAGFMSTPNAIAAGSVTLEAQKAQFVANAPSTGFLVRFPNMTRYSFTLATLGAALGRYATANGMKTAYAAFANVQAGIDASTGFTQAYTASGGKLLGTDPIPVGTAEFAPYLQRIKDAKPDAVFLFLPSFGGAGQFLQAYHNIGLDKTTKLLSTGDLVDENNLAADGDLAVGLITAYIYSAAHKSPLNAQFVKTFKALRPALEPNFAAVEGYDLMAAIAAVVAKQSGPIALDKAMTTLKGLKWESPRGPVEIDPVTRDLVQNIYIRRTERVNGKLQNTEISTSPMVHGPG